MEILNQVSIRNKFTKKNLTRVRFEIEMSLIKVRNI